MSKLTVKTFRANIEVFPNNEETWHVSISTDGLSVADELEMDSDTDEETVIENWINADIETIEVKAGRKLTDEEKEEYRLEVIGYYSTK